MIARICDALSKAHRVVGQWHVDRAEAWKDRAKRLRVWVARRAGR